MSMRILKPNLVIVSVAFLLIACGGKNSESNVDASGNEKDLKSKTLETGADLLQDKSSLTKLNTYLNGFHFYNGNINGTDGSPPLRVADQ